MIGWLFVAGTALGGCTALYTLSSGNHGARGSLAWVISLLLVPWIAVPLYWSSGRLRYRAYRSSLNRTRQRLSEHMEAINSASAAANAEFEDPVLNRFGGIGALTGNQLTLYSESTNAYSAMLEAIDNAESYVLLQSYLVRGDSVGLEIVEHLISASERGCKIALLYDEVGSSKLDNKLITALSEAGVQSSGFTVRRRFLSRFRSNFRNHRKILVIDGLLAFVGGMNLGQEYLDGGRAFEEWRDTHLRIEGPAALALQLCFCEDWLFAVNRQPDKEALCETLNWRLGAEAASGTRTVKICPTGPHDTFLSGDLLFSHLVSRATRRLWIATPYFIPDERVINHLKLAGLKGIEVKVMIPERSDYRLVDYAHQAFIADLLPYGIQVFRFQPGFTHQKVILIDDLLSSVGSANSDNRSFRLNFEVSCLVRDPVFAAAVSRMLKEDLSRCRAATLDADVPSARPAVIRMNLVRMLAPAL